MFPFQFNCESPSERDNTDGRENIQVHCGQCFDHGRLCARRYSRARRGEMRCSFLASWFQRAAADKGVLDFTPDGERTEHFMTDRWNMESSIASYGGPQSTRRTNIKSRPRCANPPNRCQWKTVVSGSSCMVSLYILRKRKSSSSQGSLPKGSNRRKHQRARPPMAQ